MLIKGKDRQIALAYIKHRYPVGTEIFDWCRSGSFIIRKNSVFEIYSDLDDMVEPDPRNEFITFLVRKPGCDILFEFKQTPKSWMLDYYKKYIEKK